MSVINNSINAPIPFASSQGGTGVVSPTAHGIMVSEGTSPMNPIVLTNGQLLIGSTGGDPVASTLTAGSGVTMTNASGSITIAATGTGGTVTSVGAMTSSTGLTITNSPITTSGNIDFELNAELQGLAALVGTGIIVETASGSYANRSIVLGGSGNLTLSNGSGISGNPTLDLNTTLTGLTAVSTGSLTMTGNVTSGTWNGSIISVPYGGTGQSSLNNNSLLVGTGTGGITQLSVGATGTVLSGMSGSNPVFTATPTVTSITIQNSPVASTDGVNKSYVDAMNAGLTFKDACVAATTANLTATYVSLGGVGDTLTNSGTLAVFTVDGQSPAVNSRILVKNQTLAYQNGIYTITNVGSGAVAWVLTRSTDYNTVAQIQPGDIIVVDTGTVNGGTSWLETATITAVGTAGNNINFSPFTYSPSAFLQVANNLSDLSNTATALTNLGLTSIATQSVTANDVLVGGPSNTIVSQPLTSGQLLIGSTGASPVAAVPTNGTYVSWTAGAGSLTVDLTGTVPVSLGGTGNTTLTSNGVLIGNGTSAVTALATAGHSVLITDGAGVPSMSSTLPNAVQNNITTTGTLSSGTWNGSVITAAYGGTGRTTIATGALLAGNAAGNVLLVSPVATGSVLVSNGAGAAPIYSSTPTVTTLIATTVETNNLNPAGAGNLQLSVEPTYAVTLATGYSTPVPLRFYQANASTYVGFQAATSIASNVTWTLPNANGTNGQVLTLSGVGSGVGTLGWTTPTTGTVTSVSTSSPLGTISLGGSPITTSGTLTFDLATTAVTPGSYTYGNFTVNAQGQLTAASSGTAPFSYTVLSSGTTSQAMVSNNGYVPTNNSTIVTFTLPSSIAAGVQLAVSGFGTAGWKITQAAAQSIYFGVGQTTVGTGGSLSSNYATDSITLLCVVANTTFTVISSVGNLTII